MVDLQRSDTEEIARRLFEGLRARYPDSDVEAKIFGSTVTIARGRRAAQILVLAENRFSVSRKKRDTFHMMEAPVGRTALAQIIEHMVGLPDPEPE